MFFCLGVIFLSLGCTRNTYSYLKRLVCYSRYLSSIWGLGIWALFQLVDRRRNDITLIFQLTLYFRTDTEFAFNAVNNMVNLKRNLYRPTIQHTLYRKKNCYCHNPFTWSKEICRAGNASFVCKALLSSVKSLKKIIIWWKDHFLWQISKA